MCWLQRQICFTWTYWHSFLFLKLDTKNSSFLLVCTLALILNLAYPDLLPVLKLHQICIMCTGFITEINFVDSVICLSGTQVNDIGPLFNVLFSFWWVFMPNAPLTLIFMWHWPFPWLTDMLPAMWSYDFEILTVCLILHEACLVSQLRNWLTSLIFKATLLKFLLLIALRPFLFRQSSYHLQLLPFMVIY